MKFGDLILPNFVMRVNRNDDLSHDFNLYQCDLFLLHRNKDKESKSSHVDTFFDRTPEYLFDSIVSQLMSASWSVSVSEDVRPFYVFRYTQNDSPVFFVTWENADGSSQIDFVSGDAIAYFGGTVHHTSFKQIGINVEYVRYHWRDKQEWLVPEGWGLAEL